MLSHGFLSAPLCHYDIDQGNFLPQVLHLYHYGRRASWISSLCGISTAVPDIYPLPLTGALRRPSLSDYRMQTASQLRSLLCPQHLQWLCCGGQHISASHFIHGYIRTRVRPVRSYPPTQDGLNDVIIFHKLCNIRIQHVRIWHLDQPNPRMISIFAFYCIVSLLTPEIFLTAKPLDGTIMLFTLTFYQNGFTRMQID